MFLFHSQPHTLFLSAHPLVALDITLTRLISPRLIFEREFFRDFAKTNFHESGRKDEILCVYMGEKFGFNGSNYKISRRHLFANLCKIRENRENKSRCS